MKIIQIASHNTNIGDGANIIGFRKTFQEDLPEHDMHFHNEEILDYKPHIGQKDFNSTGFIELANSADLVIIGGGGFFSMFKRFHNTGCHVDFTLETLKKIHTPIVYYSLGFSVYNNQKYFNLDKLSALLQYASNADNVLISLRNDGSYKRLENLLPNSNLDFVSIVPDCGFYVDVDDHYHPEYASDRKNIILQLAGDKQHYRFREMYFPGKNLLYNRYCKKIYPGFISNRDKFLNNFAKTMTMLAEKYNLNLILVPHIYSDLGIAKDFISKLPLRIIRKNLSISGIFRGTEGARYCFDLYKKADAVLGMRFHANVCSSGLLTPVFGLVSHCQLSGLYNELGMDSFSDVSNDNCLEKAENWLIKVFENPEKITDLQKEKVNKLRNETRLFHRRIADLIK